MNEEHKTAPGLWDVTRSVLAALLGVQKYKNYEKDFTHGKPWQYITIGVIGVVLFIVIILGIVNLVMSLAGV